jgi:hypothetical protein
MLRNDLSPLQSNDVLDRGLYLSAHFLSFHLIVTI